MTAYYNENDPFAAQWLRNLIAAGHITAGDVDDQSIKDVRPEDLKGYTQCHFFAGIGGWSYALRLAGWPDDKPVWTGSCPCQPFSAAGKQKGVNDERHLWPDWFSLIKECKPTVVFGEQVSAAIRQGWLDAVFSDLEGEGYACGSAVLPAAGVGAPHRRNRLWFVAANPNISGLSSWHEPRKFRPTEITYAWREFERVHATTAWLQRETESSVCAFADGIPGRVGRLRAYGNAIVPQVAAKFIKAAA